MSHTQPISPALAANESTTVNFASFSGAPTYRASGFIYGLSADAATPPQTLLSQIKVKNIRGGGSQIGCPNGGWIHGHYTARWNFVKAYYSRAKAVGARLSMILAPLWASDGVCAVPRWPGDNDNWLEFEHFMTQVINDAQVATMTGPDVRWDIWNEPDIAFWGRSQAQYLEMWRRAVNQIRAAIPGAVIEGPSCACHPGDPWFDTFLDYVKANDVIPDILSWHTLPSDPVTKADVARATLSARGMTVSGFSINEYGASGNEQQPGPSAWYIARLERADTDGARANWGMVGQTPSLHDTMGWLVTPLPANQPMGQWWVYKRYADQTGLQTNFTPSASVDGVAFQDAETRQSITLLGKKDNGGTGMVSVNFINLPSWLQHAGRVNALIERMPSTNTFVATPTVVSSSPMAVSDNTLTVNINWSNALDAYSVTLTPADNPT